MQGSDEFGRLAEVLIRRGSDALIVELKKLNTWPRDRLSALLVHLATLGGVRWPAVLHSMGADLEYVGSEGETALSQCIHGASNKSAEKRGLTFETAAELISLGASPNSSYMSMYSVTHLAVSQNLPEFALLFLLAGADLDRGEPDSQSNETLRQSMLRANKVYPELEGAAWPTLVLSILHKKPPPDKC